RHLLCIHSTANRLLTSFSTTTPCPPRSPLFPYTTLFRSWNTGCAFASTRYRYRRNATAGCRHPHRSRSSNRSSTSCRRCPLNVRSEEHTSELQSRGHLVCRLLLEKKKKKKKKLMMNHHKT